MTILIKFNRTPSNTFLGLSLAPDVAVLAPICFFVPAAHKKLFATNDGFACTHSRANQWDQWQVNGIAMETQPRLCSLAASPI